MRQIILDEQKALTINDIKCSTSQGKVIAYACKTHIAVLIQENFSDINGDRPDYGFRYLDKLFKQNSRLFFESKSVQETCRKALDPESGYQDRKLYSFNCTEDFLEWAVSQ